MIRCSESWRLLLALKRHARATPFRPGVKIRFSGGFDWPRSMRLSVTAMYFFGDRL